VNHVKIPFNKQTMWRKAIEKGTLDSCREAHKDLVQMPLPCFTHLKGLLCGGRLSDTLSNIYIPLIMPAAVTRSECKRCDEHLLLMGCWLNSY
jgi:hypothetical protein